jgi:hypothetical protein
LSYCWHDFPPAWRRWKNKTAGAREAPAVSLLGDGRHDPRHSFGELGELNFQLGNFLGNGGELPIIHLPPPMLCQECSACVGGRAAGGPGN